MREGTAGLRRIVVGVTHVTVVLRDAKSAGTISDALGSAEDGIGVAVATVAVVKVGKMVRLVEGAAGVVVVLKGVGGA